jgi:peptide/nickel transport system substrate-binding protein
MIALSPCVLADTAIRVGLSADIRSSEPGVNRDENTDTVILHVVEGLVAHREDASVGPLLASEVNVSGDGLKYTFKLREGVHFHNGAPLTSAEVKWTWQRYLDPKTQWRCLPEFDGRGGAKIVDIAAPDPQSVVFTLDQPNGLFLASMSRPDCGGAGILHPDSLAADGSWKSPVGTGPFTFSEWKPGQYIGLERFRDYSARAEDKPDGFTGNKRALVDNLRFMIIPDASSAKAALLSSNVDLLPDVTASDAQELKALPGIQVSVSPIMAICGLLFQTNDPLLKDLRIRQAIAHSLDYVQMVSALSNGLSQPNNSAIPSTSAFHDGVAKQGYTYDPVEAQRLLKEAGYKGQPIKMIVNKRYQQMFDMGVLAQAMAQSSGLNIQMETLEWGTQLERYQSGNYQMMSFSYSSRLDPALGFDSLMGDKSKEPRKVWDNPQAQTLLRQAIRESDTTQRQVLFDQLHRMMIRDTPMVIIYNGTVAGALRDSVKGYRSWPVAKPRLWGVSLAAE